MKKILLATVALVALGAIAPALAADLGARTYTKAPAYVPTPIYNWTGFYIGGHVGGGFAGSNGFSGATNSSNNGAFLGGVQVGGDYQFSPNWVVGIEGQYSWLSSSNTTTVFPTIPNASFNTNLRGLGSVTGRLGYTWGPTMVYAKGGYAYADYNQSLTIPAGPVAFAYGGHHDGYTVGGGLEYLFTQNWSGKVEYMYYNFGNSSFATPVALSTFGSTRNDEHTVKAGLNYRFNLGGLAGKY